MDNSIDFKRKATMVLFQIEESLSKYILRCETETNCLSSEFLNVMEERSKKDIFDKTSMQNVLESSYLREIFEIALKSTIDTPEYEKLQLLLDLFIQLKIFDIRNSLAHPTRPFLLAYWYRVASIASDPLIESLSLDDISEALYSAENGSIKSPPEDWLDKFNWQIKNNLPKHFEHNITGLVGRKEELKDLERVVKNLRNNTIAIIAPGGFGKTALALDLLNSAITDPSTNEWADSIIFVSMKNEKLTLKGIEQINAVETIEQIKMTVQNEMNILFNSSLKSFEEIIDIYRDKKVFLFIDNLETLLRDSENTFSEFNDTLPIAWRVLVTSRISITNSYLIPLKTLKQTSAYHLARTYVNRTIGTEITPDQIEHIIKEAHFNPLAIRLTVDLYNTGNDIPESINIANKEIADFSYNNLIEIISSNGILILEILFIKDNLTRSSLCEFLQKDLDEVVEAINELNKTSLISRSQNNEETEVYSLNSSVKDLLLKNPKNIQFREKIQEQIVRQKTLANEIEKKQQNQGIDEYHKDYIPYNLNPNLKVLIGELYNALKQQYSNNTKFINLFNKFEKVKTLYINEYIYHRAFAQIYIKLNDHKNAITCFKKAIDLNSNDFLSKVMLATLYRKDNDFNDAKEILDSLIKKKIWEVNDYIGKWIFNEYFRTLLYDHDYETVLTKTEKWEISPKYPELLGCYRASAWKRKVESIIDSNHKDTIEALNNSIETMNNVISKYGYFVAACAETVKIFDEIDICLTKEVYKNQIGQIDKWLLFIEEHILNIVNSSYKDFNEAEAKSLIRNIVHKEIVTHKFNTRRWKEYVRQIYEFSIDINEAIKLEYIVATIYRIPQYDENTYSRNLFVEDTDSNQYYVHKDKFKGSFQEWKNLEIDMKLAIKKDNAAIGKTTPVTEALIVNEY